ncbi:MAG: hypothetical protein AAGA16_02065 [Cyanobacteria bacterium P01_E01_bin.35]
MDPAPNSFGGDCFCSHGKNYGGGDYVPISVKKDRPFPWYVSLDPHKLILMSH